MLFDLRSPGRRAAVKVVYTMLAIVMGAGLILFGIGSATSGGGLFDAFSHPFGIGEDDAKSGDAKREEALLAKVRKNPRDANSWVQLANIRYKAAQAVGEFNQQTGQIVFGDKSKEKLREAGHAWESYLKLDPKNPNARVAALMAFSFGPQGINQPAKAATAQEIVAEARPTAANYANVAIYAYLADQTQRGDLASKKAVELTPKKQRATYKKELDKIKAQIFLENAQKKKNQLQPSGQ